VAAIHAEGFVKQIANLEWAQAKWDCCAHLLQLWGRSSVAVPTGETGQLCVLSSGGAILTNGKAGPVDDVRVLFVEDDPAVAQMYKLKLELDGYHVEVAPDGEVALRMARSARPDIIFLDIRLPKLGGLEVLEALRADPETKTVPVVILSSHSEKELVERGARLGALDHLIKSKTTPAKLAGGVDGWLKDQSVPPKVASS
jgi:CheY-like chemotaxis protein